MSVPPVAIVTGAAGGIGAATARRLAEDGLDVAVADLDAQACAGTVESVRATGRAALAVAVDVTQREQVDAAVAEVAAQLGPPVVLVNNAGVIRDNLVHRMTDDDWDQVLGVHVRGAFLMSRAAQTHMVEQRWGRIVTMSSISALGNRAQGNYAAAKAALQGFTKALAIELGPFGVTCNAVAPGFVSTRMTHAWAERLGMTPEEHEAEFAKSIPVGRVGVPDDVAHAVSFFVSRAAGYVNGQVLYVAGGPHS